MERTVAVVRGSESYEPPIAGPAVTIGNFDGVHLGHRALLRAAREAVGKPGVVCVYTFDPTPRDVMAPGHGVPAIQSLDDKLRTLARAGADHVVVEPFDLDFAEHTPRWFCEEILVRRLHASAVVVGWDFRFGKNRAGTFELLRSLLDVPVVRVPAIAVDGEVVSSTRVRQLVQRGDVRAAARLLGRPHELVGEVVHGDKRGRRIGVPTANIVPDTELLPAAGVYAVRVQVGATWYGGVANLGVRPTFRPGDGRLEVHVFDLDADLYGQTLRVAVVERIREERSFATLEALASQIRADVALARQLLSATK